MRAIKIYPLASAANPKLVKFVDLTDTAIDIGCLKWEDNIQYWPKPNIDTAAAPRIPDGIRRWARRHPLSPMRHGG
jgi:hypothetical protein